MRGQLFLHLIICTTTFSLFFFFFSFFYSCYGFKLVKKFFCNLCGFIMLRFFKENQIEADSVLCSLKFKDFLPMTDFSRKKPV